MEHSYPGLNSDQDPYDEESFEDLDDTKDEKKDKKKKKSLPFLLSVEEVQEKQASEKVEDKPSLFGSETKEPESVVEDRPPETVQDIEASVEAPADTLEAEVEHLSVEEQNLAMQNLVQAHQAEIDQELASAEADEGQPEAAQGVAAFLKRVADRLSEGQPADEALLDDSLNEIVEQLEDEPAVEEPLETESLGERDDSEELDDDDETPVPAAPPISPSGSAGSASGAGGPPRPPIPPIPPTPPASGGAGLPPTPPPPITPRTPDSYAPSGGLDTEVETEPDQNRNRQRRKDLLVGGIVGYFIGKRRGRIKTEEKLLPVQHALEKKVSELDDQLTIREDKIRKLTAEKAASLKQSTEAAPIEKVESVPPKKPEVGDKTELIIEHEPPKPKLENPDKLGNILIPKPEQIEARPTASEVKNKPLKDFEILQKASHIKYNGVDLRQLFNAGRLDKNKLRLIVERYETGGDYQRLIAENLRPERQEGIERLPEPLDSPEYSGTAAAAQFTQSQPGQPNHNQPVNSWGQNHDSSQNMPVNSMSPTINKTARPLIAMAVVVGLIVAAILISLLV